MANESHAIDGKELQIPEFLVIKPKTEPLRTQERDHDYSPEKGNSLIDEFVGTLSKKDFKALYAFLSRIISMFKYAIKNADSVNDEKYNFHINKEIPTSDGKGIIVNAEIQNCDDIILLTSADFDSYLKIEIIKQVERVQFWDKKDCSHLILSGSAPNHGMTINEACEFLKKLKAASKKIGK